MANHVSITPAIPPTPTRDIDIEGLSHQLLADIASDSPSHVCLEAPRRRRTDGNLASAVAETMYPDMSPVAAVIKYEANVVALRKTVIARMHDEEEARRDAKGRPHRQNVRRQGPWSPPGSFFADDSTNDDCAGFARGKKGFKAIPMPVEVAKHESLAPFFEYLRLNKLPSAVPNVEVFESHGNLNEAPKDTSPTVLSQDAKPGYEPYYGVDMLEFNKGVVYTDSRMDLCKMVVGPNHIQELMHSLGPNKQVKHFLLGNNIIGPTGAHAIADFIRKHPDRMETWYLAGNMIDTDGFAAIVDAVAGSQIMHSLWLKRNPLGPKSADCLAKLIIDSPKLRVLDLDQTELSDHGIKEVFDNVGSYAKDTVGLETVYLNGTGASKDACYSIGSFLRKPACRLENLYLSGNPIGDPGACALAERIMENTTLKRLALTSCGLTSSGVKALTEALTPHPAIISLDIGQAIYTEDLGARYNYIEDDAIDSVGELITKSKTLRYLNLGTTGFTIDGLRRLDEYVTKSGLFYFQADSCLNRSTKADKPREILHGNVRRELGLTWEGFIAGPLRYLRSPEDVRYIDSVYRNRDAAAAKRGLMVLKKDWEADDQTMEEVTRYKTNDTNAESLIA